MMNVKLLAVVTPPYIYHTTTGYLWYKGLLKNLQSHLEAYPFDHHQTIHHQFHHIVLVVKEKKHPKKNPTRNYLQVFETILIIIHWSLMMI